MHSSISYIVWSSNTWYTFSIDVNNLIGGIMRDFTTLMMGASFTWFGALTGMINVIILGKGWDYLERV